MIFNKRNTIKPYEYADVNQFIKAIRKAYWTHDEYTSEVRADVQTFKVKLSEAEQEAVKRAALMIAQIEVDVKKFWSDIDETFPKPEFSFVGATFAECHGEGTEVMTPKGWVDFREINVGDKVFQFDPKTKQIIVTTVKAKVDEPYTGKLYELKNRDKHFQITPNHRIIYYDKKNQLQESTIEKLGYIGSERKLPIRGFLQGKNDFLSVDEKLLIAIQADGSSRFWRKSSGERVRRGLSSDCYTYDISVSKSRKKERLLSLLESTSFTYRQENTNKEGYIKYSIDVPTSFGDAKFFDWVDLSDKSTHWCEEFIQELAEWDGYRLDGKGNAKKCLVKYSTTNKTCADIAQMVGYCAGYSTKISTYVDNRKSTYKDVYTVSFTLVPDAQSINTRPTTIDYEGRVYCVTVDTGAIITRFNDKVLFSGNSEVRHFDGYQFLLEKLNLSKIFEDVEGIPAVQKRIDYLNKIKSLSISHPKDAIKSLILFSICVENISLFSQFLTIMSFQQYKNYLSGFSTIVEATSKEEAIHAQFGFYLVNLARAENPDWFDKDFIQDIKEFVLEVFESERAIVDWIFEQGELDFLPKNVIIEFMKHRLNESAAAINMPAFFDDVDPKAIADTEWFDAKILGAQHSDFFYKRPTTYTKRQQSFTTKDLF